MSYLSLANKYSVDYVKSIQRALKFLGFYKYSVDGVYGMGTWRAVKKFQALHGLVEDGDAGSTTYKYLFPNMRLDISSDLALRDSSSYPHDDPNSLDSFYGTPGISVERSLRSYKTPYPLYYGGSRVRSIRLHRKCADSFLGLFEDIASIYNEIDIAHLGLNLYGGSYNHRYMRGANRWSTHAYGCALDLDPVHNSLHMNHTQARFARPAYRPFWESVTKHGLYSLGIHHDYDWMHIQAAYR